MSSNNKTHPLYAAMISLFFTGLWTDFGFNPVIRVSELTIRTVAETTAYGQNNAFAGPFPGPGELIGILHTAALLITIGAVVGCLVHGRILGLVGGGATYLAGVVILDAHQPGTFLLIAGFFLGTIGLLLNDSNQGSGRSGPSVTHQGLR
ncbi:hypothetical protein M0R88_09550 [Halorussus gelatinilyticus]|uniref:Uncharacterized protein n=1 Tax=Halorussus gelatinilyticus TaxID=2937524 RepID=A0A8U0ICK9_9EURY|nr:hypothetical protein [Halorussus gelatinilyticus]UPV98776.1 hypothetical protein M0R88_09550 [Halorussus gelatinilyticus]